MNWTEYAATNQRCLTPEQYRCLVVENNVTRDDLLARGLTEPAADELLSFAAHLRRECDPSSCRFNHRS